jgi:hypothetical protein
LNLLWSRIKMYLRQNEVSSVAMVVTTYLVMLYYLNVIKLKAFIYPRCDSLIWRIRQQASHQ